MRRAQSAGIRALAVILPGGAHGHAAVLIEFHPGLGGVPGRPGPRRTRQSHAHAAFDFGGGKILGAFLGGFILGPHDVEHLRQAHDFGGLARGRGVTFLVAVEGAQLKGSMPSFSASMSMSTSEGNSLSGAP